MLSAYKIEKESSSFKTNTKPVSFTENVPTKYIGDKVLYGPYENQNPFTKVFFILFNHFECIIFRMILKFTMKTILHLLLRLMLSVLLKFHIGVILLLKSTLKLYIMVQNLRYFIS